MTEQEQVHKCRWAQPQIGAVYCRRCLRYQMPEDFCEYADPRGKKITGKSKKSKRSTAEKFDVEGDIHDPWRK